MALHSGYLVGPQRFFGTEKSRLLNLTDSRTGTIYFKEWAPEEKTVSIFQCQQTDLGKRCIVINKNSLFEEMISCLFVTVGFFVNCYNFDIEVSEINLDSCKVLFQISNESINSNDTFNMIVSSEEIIEKISMESSLKCTISLSSWLEYAENPKIFWYYFNENDKPLNLHKPEIELEIKYAKGRPGWKSKKVKIESLTGGLILFEGTMYEGKLKGLVDPKLANNPGWRSRLMIGIYNFELNYLEQSVVGSFKDGKLDGLIQIYGKMTVDPKGHLSSRFFEGLSFIGWFEKGKPVGLCWKFLVGGTYIYGIVDENGDFTGQDIAFIYQDLELALVGEFKDGIMVRFTIQFGFLSKHLFQNILKHNK